MEKISKEIDDRMYEAYQRIWVGGMIVVKRFDDYQELVEDLDKLDYDTKEYHRLIDLIKSSLEGKV